MANPKIEVEIAANLDNIDQQFAKVASMATGAVSKINAAFSSINLGVLGGAFSFAGFAASVKSFADGADAMAKLSSRTGETVENLSKLKFAADLSDVSTESLQKGLVKLNKVMGEASDGSKEATGALARFGIMPNNGKSLIDNFAQIAERVKNTGDETRIATALNDVFGKSFADLIPLLKGGASGIKESGDELERLGGVMGGDLAKSAEAFNDNLTRIEKSLEALKISSLSGVVSGLEELSSKFVSATKAAGGFWSGLMTWSTTDRAEESDPGAGIANLIVKLNKLEEMKAAFTKDTWINRLGLNKEDLAIVNVQIEGMTLRLKYLQELQAKNGQDGYRDSWMPRPEAGKGITDAPAKAVADANKISDGERLIQQLRERVMTVQQLSEVEKIESNILEGKYAVISRGEADVALALAAQIDARSQISKELDDEIARVKEITKQFDEQDSRLKSLIAATPAGQATQKMLDEALAESELRKQGESFRPIYDQIIEKLHEVKKEGKDTFDELARAIDGWGKDAAAAIVDFGFGAKTSFSDMVNSILKDLARMTIYEKVTNPVAGKVKDTDWSTFFSKLIGNANGGVYNSPSLSAYSNGVYDSPRFFRFASGAGVFGEAGPEAIMPLKRGSDGKLGVQASGGRGQITLSPTYQISIDSRTDQAQVQALVAKAVRAGNVQLVNDLQIAGVL